jgi:hypothetical protein
MTFIQSIEFATEQRDAVLELMKRWTTDAVGTGTALRETVAEDRLAPGRFVVAVAFESAATAAQTLIDPRPERLPPSLRRCAVMAQSSGSSTWSTPTVASAVSRSAWGPRDAKIDTQLFRQKDHE